MTVSRLRRVLPGVGGEQGVLRPLGAQAGAAALMTPVFAALASTGIRPRASGEQGGPGSGRAPLPEPRCPRYHSLDLWRGVACLLVVVFHTTDYVREVGPPDEGAGPGRGRPWEWPSLLLGRR